ECRAPINQGNINGDAGYRSRDNTRRNVLVETSDALVVQDNALIMQDGLGYDWSYIAQDEPTEFALMAYTLGSNTEVQSCSKNCLESIEAQLIVHQKNEAVYEEKITVLEFKEKDKGNAVTGLTNQLEQTLKEKEDLKAKLEQNYMPPLADLSFAGLDDSVYRPAANKTSASLVELSLKIGNEPVKSDKQAVKPRMVTQSPKGKGTSHREVRLIWNNTQRINHQNKFVPTTILTRSGRIPVSTAKQVSKEKVNTVKVNGVNTAGQTAVSTVKGNGVTVVKASAGCV
ncbi:hypothetical protein Tco_1121287, partial [Tanacetum coccineum]